VKIVTTDEMIRLERESDKRGIPPSTLMENAGLAIAQRVTRLLEGAAGRHILILVGPGNNGGDGLVAARHLHDWGARVEIYLLRPRKDDDKNFQVVRDRGIPISLSSDDQELSMLDHILSGCDAVIDAIFGTGKLRPLEGVIKDTLLRAREEKQSRPGLKVVAVDLPSGVDSDTGAADGSCLPADLTITLGYPKIGSFSFPGRDFIGELAVADIGIPAELGDGINTELITKNMIRTLLPQRPRNANKGTFGKVLVCAGSLNYIGAAYLACEAAMRVGAGLVTLATPRSLQPVLAVKLTEVTYAPLPEGSPGFIGGTAAQALHDRLADYDVLLMGCGLSQNPEVTAFVAAVLLEMPEPLSPAMVLDADALNAIAQTPQWWRMLTKDAILTPHPGEMARLSRSSVEKITQDRLMVAREQAAKWKKTVVLKGAHTILASPDGRAMISGTANPGLASAGTGDVLAGAIAGLLAQGLSYTEASACGVYLHGLAADMVRQEIGDAGMVASDLLPVLPQAIKKVKES